MSNLGAFLAVVLPLGLVFYVIRGGLVSREAYAQEREKVRRIKEENKALERYNRALRRNQEASQPGVQWVSEKEFEERRRQAQQALRRNHFSGALSRQMAEAMQDRQPEDQMPVIQPYYDYPFPATEPPEDR